MSKEQEELLAALNEATRHGLGQVSSTHQRDALLGGVLVMSGVLAGGKACTQAKPASAMAAVTDKDLEYMRLAIEKMRLAGVVEKTGGPFGAVIAREGKILAASGNSVIRDKDPSAHAEVNAIRQACRALGTVDLKGSVLYSSCECCPMCYSTAFWARISKIFYAAAWSDYQDIFDDVKLSQDMQKPYAQRLLAPQPILRADARKVWAEFRNLPDGARY